MLNIMDISYKLIYRKFNNGIFKNVEHIVGGYIELSDILDDNQKNDQPQHDIKDDSPKKDQKADPNIKFYNIDNVMEFRQKVAKLLNIPIYRQHIIVRKNNTVIPLFYSLLNHFRQINLDIENIINSNYETINHIPIVQEFVNKKDGFVIKSLESFKLMTNIPTTLYIYDLNDFTINIKDINDENQLELIYYGFVILFFPMLNFNLFKEYIKQSNFNKIYNFNYVSNEQLIIENNFIEEMQVLKSKDKIYQKLKDLIKINIYSSTIQNFSFGITTSNIINIRNVFDKFKLTNQITALKANITYNNDMYILNKTYKDNIEIQDNIAINSIAIRINIDENVFLVRLFKNGNYDVKCIWDDNNIDFNITYDIVSELVNKNIIKVINEYNINNIQIPNIKKETSNFTDINMSLYYNKKIEYNQLGLLSDIFEELSRGNIVKRINETSYYILKGMHQYDPDLIFQYINTNNTYDYLTDNYAKEKWEYVYLNNRRIDIIFHNSIIEIKVVGIKENEINIFYDIIINIFYMLNVNITANKLTNTVILKENRSIKSLKNQDPNLFNIKKIYNLPIIYSKLCQKQNQPKIILKSEADEINKHKSNTAIKYWNFTTNSENYYYCPNSKYPYLHFLTNKHPKGYCLPCCKMTQLDNKSKIKQDIFNKCVNEYIYKYVPGENELLNKYIMNYGKYIEPGRLCNLPEKTLEPLFYESYSNNIEEQDERCYDNDRFFVMGVLQNVNGINAGFLNCLSIVLEKSTITIIEEIIDYLNKHDIFKFLLNGGIYKYFTNNDNLISELSRFLSTDIFTETINQKTKWNDILFDISYYVYNIFIIQFQDDDRFNTKSQHSNIYLKLPNYINNADDIINPEYKSMIVLTNDDLVYPIFIVNPNVYFTTNVISKKIFDYNDDVIVIIKNLIKFELERNNAEKPFSIIVLEKYLLSVNKKITTYFINKHNLCYYIEINNGELYLPIYQITYTYKKDINVIFTPYYRNIYKTTFINLNKFLLDFNKWCLKNELNIIKIEKLLNYKDTCIGFLYDNLNFYICNGTKIKDIIKIKDAPIINTFYDIDDINKVIYNNQPAQTDNRSKNITKSIYDYKLYELLIMEFINAVQLKQNNKFRHIIIKHIVKGEYSKIQKATDEDDYRKIMNIINKATLNFQSSKEIIEEFNKSIFNFDKERYIKLQQMETKQLKTELYKMLKDSIVFDKFKLNQNIENVITSCNSDNIYCKRNKLIMDKKRYDSLIEILAADIKNPLKEKWLFSNIFNNNTLNYFKFEHRVNENITITIK